MISPTWKPIADATTRRADLPDSVFAFPRQRREPLVDAAHVRNALARFAQVGAVDDDERAVGFANILAAAAYYGVHVKERDWHDFFYDDRSDVPRCSIVPPYVLVALANAEDPKLAAAAHETILLTAELDRQRQMLAAERGTRHLEGERRVVYDAAHGRTLRETLLRREGEPKRADGYERLAIEPELVAGRT